MRVKQAEGSEISRDKLIIRTSIIGIIANAFLAGFKAVVGFFSNSIAIVLDAVNNLSDAASSVITIVGTKLASKEPDKKHPFGHGRVEYLSALTISLIVLYAGITSFTSSVKKIIYPETPEYGTASIVIVTAAIIVKIVLGKYVKGVGVKVRSDSLINSGEDAVLDSVISASTLAAAVIYLLTKVSLEAWLGVIISAVIIKSGYEMIKDTISRLLGERVDPELALGIKETINSFPDVSGAYDLVLNDYGPDSINGSVHVEIPDTYSADELDELLRDITLEVYKKHNVILTAIGVYSVNLSDTEAMEMREIIKKKMLENEYVLQLHGFNFNRKKKVIRFDLVISFDAPDRHEVYRQACATVAELYPGNEIQIALDTDYSELSHSD